MKENNLPHNTNSRYLSLLLGVAKYSHYIKTYLCAIGGLKHYLKLYLFKITLFKGLLYKIILVYMTTNYRI